MADRRIVEASGLGVGHRSSGVLYVENDSGDSARFFAVSATTCATVATVTVPDAVNHDWEDLAVAPDRAGEWSVWLADIGDNDAQRDQIELYRVAEPDLAAGARDRAVTSARPEVWHLRYPDGHFDAEALAVTPGGRAYLITKSFNKAAGVYAVPATSAGGALQTLRRVATLDPSVVGVTGGTISADGRLLVLRTYFAAYGWRLGPGGVPAALRSRPVDVALPLQPQGEGVAVRGDDLLVDSEGADSAIFAIPLPAALRPAPTSPGRSSLPEPAGSSGSAGSGRAPHRAAPRSARPRAATSNDREGGHQGGGGSPLRLALAIAAAAAVAVAGAGWPARRRRAGGNR